MNYRKILILIVLSLQSFCTILNANEVSLINNSTLNYSQNGTVIRSAYVGRYFRYERLYLRQLLGIDHFYRGYNLESIVVNARSFRGGQIDLLINNWLVQSQNPYSGEVYFGLTGGNIIDEQILNFDLGIKEEIYIESVRVVLRDPRNSGPTLPEPNPPSQPSPPDDGNYSEIRVPLSFSQQMYDHDKMRLSDFVDLRAYVGYSLIGIQFYATPRKDFSVLYINIDDVQATQSLDISRTVNRYESYFSFRPVLTLNTKIDLYNTEEVSVNKVSLILKRVAM